MFIRKVSVTGIKGIGERVDFDFSPSDNSKYFEDNIEDFGITKNAEEFKVLKQIAFIGLNSSGKTSALIGIQTGLAILANPFNSMQYLKSSANVFWDKPFVWEFEIITIPSDSGVKVARKYKVYLELFKNQIVKESVSVIESSRTSQKDEVLIYSLESNKIKVGDKTYGHNTPLLTVFSLIRTGQVSAEIQKVTNKFLDLFVGINWFNEKSFDTSNPFIKRKTFDLPKSDSDLSKLNKLMSIFDPQYIELKTDQFNNPVLTINQNGSTKSIEGYQAISNILSKGTMETLKLNHSLFTASSSSSIAFYDEIDNSMHAGMFGALLELLRKSSKSQMIFTTHTADIFTQNLRLDQINVIKNNGNSITCKRVADYEGVNDRTATLKSIKRAIKNSPNSKEVMEAVDEFAS